MQFWSGLGGAMQGVGEREKGVGGWVRGGKN